MAGPTIDPEEIAKLAGEAVARKLKERRGTSSGGGKEDELFVRPTFICGYRPGPIYDVTIDPETSHVSATLSKSG